MGQSDRLPGDTLVGIHVLFVDDFQMHLTKPIDGWELCHAVARLARGPRSR